MVKASALYLGSAVPLETAVGLEAFQMPCRERYWSALDSCMKVDGIDSSIVAYSSGLLLQVRVQTVLIVTFSFTNHIVC